MALLTEDITLPTDGQWLAVVATGATVIISEIRGAPKSKMLFRFGISSTSKGTVLQVGDSLAAEETIYVKSLDTKSSPLEITVTRDSV
jgi:hypothetical protein